MRYVIRINNDEMEILIVVLAVAVLLLYLKWIVIIVMMPFMAAYGRYRNNRDNKLWKVLAIPAWGMEKVMRGGWERYLLFQVATIPSLHLRKAVYKALGAHISDRVVFHFKTEIRAPYGLKIGGVQS